MGKIKNFKKELKEETAKETKELTYNIFQSNNLVPVLNKIYTCTKFNIKLSYRLHKLTEIIKDANFDLISKNEKMIEGYAEKDEEGILKKDDKNEVIIPDENKEKVEKEFRILLETIFYIPLVRLRIETDLPDKLFSPSDFSILELIFDLR